MNTTIQIDEKTLNLLKKLKKELAAHSYNETITKIVLKEVRKKSFVGGLSRFYGKVPLKKILEGLREKDDRY